MIITGVKRYRSVLKLRMGHRWTHSIPSRRAIWILIDMVIFAGAFDNQFFVLRKKLKVGES